MDIPSIMAKNYSYGKELGFSEILLQTLLNSVGDGYQSERMIIAEDAAEILTGFIGFATSTLTKVGIKVDLPDIKKNHAIRFISRLNDAGIDDTQRRRILDIASSGVMVKAYEILPLLQKMLERIHEYLVDTTLPTEHWPGNLYSH